MKHLYMEYSEDAGIPKRVVSRACFTRNHHYIAMGTGIHGVLVSAHIIGGVVHTKDLGRVDAVSYYPYCALVTVGKDLFISIEVSIEKPAQ